MLQIVLPLCKSHMGNTSVTLSQYFQHSKVAGLAGVGGSAFTLGVSGQKVWSRDESESEMTPKALLSPPSRTEVKKARRAWRPTSRSSCSLLSLSPLWLPVMPLVPRRESAGGGSQLCRSWTTLWCRCCCYSTTCLPHRGGRRKVRSRRRRSCGWMTRWGQTVRR